MKPCFWLLICCGFLVFDLTACQAEVTSLPHWRWERAEAGLPRRAIMLAVAADPLTDDRFWAGYYAPAGLATTHDGGQTWTTGAAGLADNPVFDLLPQPILSNGQVDLWAATRDGLLGSADAGASWQPVTGLPAVTAFALAADATGRLYVGLDGVGVYAEAQNGQGWQALAANESPLASAAVISLAVSPDGRYLYAGTSGQGVFASQDGGQTWQSTYPGRYITNLAVNPVNPTQAMASLREQTIKEDGLARVLDNYSTQDRLTRTLDGGQSWHTLLSLAWAQDEVTALLWLADGVVGAGTGQGEIYRSPDSGETWQQGGPGRAAGSILGLAAVRSASGVEKFLAATWNGLYASIDEGQTWAYLAPSVGSPNAQTLLTTDAGVLLGAQTGLFRWQPDTRCWTLLTDEFPLGVASLAVAPQDGQRLYLGTSFAGVYYSHDAGASWQPTSSPGVGIPALAVDPQEPNHLYLLAAWERPYESQDGGQTWHARWAGLGEVLETTSLAVDPLEPVVYVGTETGLYRSRKLEEWQGKLQTLLFQMCPDWLCASPYRSEIWQLVAPELNEQSILALLPQAGSSIFGNDPVLYIGATRGAYRSLDRGDTVQGPTGEPGWGYGLADISVTAFLADPAESRLLYAGTAYAGVYQSANGGQTWQPIGPPDLSDEVVKAMAWGPDEELFVAAAGGVWVGQRVD
ncbi:MAG: hypothetical protein JW953_03500 [Anaerolineae bacterium]|nr:hypothetical protein [Anaerolineae bacterium]